MNSSGTTWNNYTDVIKDGRHTSLFFPALKRSNLGGRATFWTLVIVLGDFENSIPSVTGQHMGK